MEPPTGSLPQPALYCGTAAPAPTTPKVPDFVQMPPFETFRAEIYAAPLGHADLDMRSLLSLHDHVTLGEPICEP
jgi:hypothetical protein